MDCGRLVLFFAICIACFYEGTSENLGEIETILESYIESYMGIIKNTTIFNKKKSSCLRCMEEYLNYEVEKLIELIDSYKMSKSSNSSGESTTDESKNHAVENIVLNFNQFKTNYEKWTQTCQFTRMEKEEKIPKFEDVINDIKVENLISGNSSEGLQKCINKFMTPVTVAELKMLETFYKDEGADSGKSRSKHSCYGCMESYVLFESKRVNIKLLRIIGNRKIETVLPDDIENFFLANELIENYVKYKKNIAQWKKICEKSAINKKKEDMECLVKKIRIKSFINHGKTYGMMKCINPFINDVNQEAVSAGKVKDLF
ncbi:uncharacterized protein LOC142327520 [Lycorma delicatula]|uniref:uncharacterized protein LOC142327520 n=1 Tax=Lycorma delicatula TaxID=130591 RepID=UPI003F5166D4